MKENSENDIISRLESILYQLKAMANEKKSHRK